MTHNPYPAPGPHAHQNYGPGQGNVPPPPPGWSGPPAGPGWPGPPPGAPPGYPPGAPPGPPRRGRRVAVVVAVVVALVAVAGGIWFFTRGGGDDLPDTAAAQDWQAGVDKVGVAEAAWRVPQGEAPEAIRMVDHWVTEQHLVRRLPGRVAAYDLKSGDVAWEFPLEGTMEDHCPSSQEHSESRVALLRSTEDPDKAGYECGTLTVLDISTGKEVFTTDLPPVGRTEVNTPDVPVVFGERVVIPSEAGVRVLDLGTGEVRAMPNPENPCVSTKVGLFGETLLAQAECEEGDTDSVRLRAFDANLDMMWEWEVPPGEDGDALPVYGVLSLDPLVVEVGHSGREHQLMRVHPESGETVPIEDYDGGAVRGGFMSACNQYAIGTCELARVVDNKVILTTAPQQINPNTPEASPGMQSTEFRNELVAFDLDTGEEAWRTGMVDGRALSLVPTADDSVAAYQPMNPNGSKGIVFSVDPATGDLTPLVPIGQQAHEDDDLFQAVRAFSFGGDNHRAVLRDGLFIVFSATHRTATMGDVDIVAFALAD
ncbi:PQQ-like beta-propeller repeat protein [Actinophytocola gossypii]|uniref:PQQ-binding-like beta-propeller repeat protein n=1 Tax=Actinophytocola gossypii TaxID=2812003 RepID=A0ABT2JG69_9PSEU|nr:PQQ-like beta-propeller repeat protein [Actinophytocola gossypii]MCT2586758.1 PQQ-binding-like beta-propeller repeat protein [Actinophytocola gossypii]